MTWMRVVWVVGGLMVGALAVTTRWAAADAEGKAAIPSVRGHVQLYDPMSSRRLLLEKTNQDAPPMAGKWQRIEVPHAARGASAVILNVYAHVRGFAPGAADGKEPRVSFTARRPGSTEEPGNYSFAVYAQSNHAYAVGQSTVYVPVNDDGCIEAKWEILMSGGANDSGHLKVYVQGFVTE